MYQWCSKHVRSNSMLEGRQHSDKLHLVVLFSNRQLKVKTLVGRDSPCVMGKGVPPHSEPLAGIKVQKLEHENYYFSIRPYLVGPYPPGVLVESFHILPQLDSHSMDIS